MSENEIIEYQQGWDIEAEERCHEEICADAKSAGWMVDFSEIKSALANVANDVELPPADFPVSNYGYVQSYSNGCSAINTIRAITALQERLKFAGKRWAETRYFEAWNYMTYHAYIVRDYNYGGCTINGMAQAINKYGILPYGKVSAVPITDKEMVQLGWNNKKRAEDIMEDYGDEAEKWQVMTTVPKTEDDVRTILDAGYPVVFGTTRLMAKGADGYYRMTTTKTAHCECFIGARHNMGVKTYYAGNSWNDNIAPIKWEDISALLKVGIPPFGMYGIINVEES